ncbi:hypothetical protein Q5752_002277 [Cryptotrichosporon argae]
MPDELEAYHNLSPSPRPRDDADDDAPDPDKGTGERKAAKVDGQQAPRGSSPLPDVMAPNPAVEKLEDELQCGMCSAVFIDPVALDCGHVYCGSCCTLWLQSIPPYPASLHPGDPDPKPVACPHCRYSPIKTAIPSRIAKTMVSVLLSIHSGAARTPGEVRQAEDVYNPAVGGGVIKFPTPPPPARPLSTIEYWRPCKSCYPTDPNAWRCPVPVARADVPSECHLCLRMDSICPDGHRLCAGCNQLSPCDSPTSISCSMCGEGYCGKPNANQCECKPLASCKPSHVWSPLYLAIEDCPNDMVAISFRDNWTEIGHLVGYLDANKDDRSLTAEAIFGSILGWIRSPECAAAGGLAAMLSTADIGMRLRAAMTEDIQAALAMDAQGNSTSKVCGGCIDELFIVGLLGWWTREIAKPEVQTKLPKTMLDRPNCKNGRKCTKQEKESHCKKYNHLCEPLPADQAAALQQDDSQPTAEASVSTQQETQTQTQPESESEDDGNSDDEEEDGKSSVHVGVQYGEFEGGQVIYVTGKTEADVQATPVETPVPPDEVMDVDQPFVVAALPQRFTEVAANPVASGSLSPLRASSRPNSRSGSPIPCIATANIIRAASPSAFRRAATPSLANLLGPNVINGSPLASPTLGKFNSSLSKLAPLGDPSIAMQMAALERAIIDEA